MIGSNDEAVVSLVVDASGLQRGSTEAVALGKRIIDSFQAIQTAANQVTGSVSASGAGIVKSLGDTNRFLGQIERSLNPLAAAANKAQVEMNRLIGIMGGSNVEAAQRAANALGLQAQKVLELKNALQSASQENKIFESTMASLERNFQSAISSLNGLISKYQPATASARQMAGELASLERAFKEGLITEQNYVGFKSQIVNSYNEQNIAAQRLSETRARLIAQARQEQEAQTAQFGIQQVTGPTAGPEFTRDLRLQMEGEAEAVRNQMALDKEMFDLETRGYERLAQNQKEKINEMIGNLKIYQDEQARINKEQFIFAQQIAPSSNIVQHNRDIADAAKKAAQEQDNLTRATQIFISRIDPAVELERKYNLAISEASMLLQKGTITQEQYNKALSLPKEQLLGMSSGIRDVTTNSRLMSYALTNFSFQINDVVSGLAMGQSAFRIFAQQGGQFFQIFQQIGFRNIGQFFKDMGKEIADAALAFGKWLTGPVGAVVGIITAISAAFAVMFTRASTNEGIMRRFGASLEGIGVPAANTSRDLLQLSYDLRAVGVSASDAENSINSLARNLSINRQNPNAIASLAQLGLNVGARLGIGDVAGIAKINEITSQGNIAQAAEAVAKLGLQTRAFSQEEAEVILKSAALGDGLAALERGIGLLSDRLKDEQDKRKSGWTQFIDSVGAGWNAVINKLSDTSVFQGIDSLFARMANNLKFIIQGQPTNPGMWPSEQEMRQRASGLIRQGPSVYGPGIGSNLLPGGSLSELNNLPGGVPFPTLQNNIRNFNPNPLNYSPLPQSLNLTSQDFGPGSPFGNVAPIDIGTRTYTAVNNNGRWVINVGEVARSFVSSNSGLMPFNPSVQPFETNTNLFNFPSTELSAEAVQTDKLNERSKQRIELAKEWAIQQKELTAFAEAYNSALDSGVSKVEAQMRAETAGNEAKKVAIIELDKQAQVQKLTNDLTLESVTAYGKDAVAGEQATARIQARVLALTTSVNEEQKYKEILLTNAAAALQSAAQQNASQVAVIDGQRKIAEAAKISGQAEHDARVEDQARIQTQDALNKARATGNQTLIQMAENLNKTAQAEIREKEAAQNSLNTTRELNQARDTIQVMRLQVNLQGQTAEQINAQVAILQKKQELERDTTGLTQQQKDQILGATDAVQRMNIELANSNRAWQRIEEGIRSIAEQISSSLTNAIENLFNRDKITNWTETFKNALRSIGSQLIQMSLIRPLIGTALGAFGLTNLAQSFGTFGNLFGGNSSNLSGLPSGSIVGIPNSSGGFSFQTLGSVASLANNTSQLFGGGGGLFGNLFGNSSITGGVNSAGLFGLGGLFGSQGPLFGTAADISILGGGPPLALGADLASFGGTSGLGLGSAAGIFGSLGSLLPIAGIGIGLGSLLLGNLFGGHKPSVATGARISGTGVVSGLESAGGPNQSAANQLIQTLSTFIQSIEKLTNGTFIGNLNPQVFSNQQGQQVFRVAYNTRGPFGSGKVESTNAQDVINMIELGLIRSLSNVSDTIKTVFNTITDPNQIQDALDFINVYEDLRKAADSAFSSLDTDTQKIGPFEQALNQINSTFKDITDKAKQYGLSLEPVNAALNFTIERLRSDVNQYVNNLILSISDPATLALKELRRTGKALLDDVAKVGGDVVRVQEYNTLALKQLWKSQAQSILDLQRELTTGAESGLTLVKQVQVANDNFRMELALVRGGNLSELGNLGTAGQNLIQLSQTTYGNAPQTARIRNEILTAIDDILSTRGFAEGTISTPKGYILVGENGPEWIKQSGGMQVFPNGTNPFGNTGSDDELISELRQVKELLMVNNRIAQGVGARTVENLEKIANKEEKRPLVAPTRSKVA